MKDQRNTHFDIWQSVLKEERAFIRLFGRDAVDEVLPTFMAILGAEAAGLFEEGFCETSGCPLEKLNDFLRVKWNQHHAGRVARLEEAAGPFPVLLIRRRGAIYLLEIWSPKDIGEALICAPRTRELSHEDMVKLSAILGGPDNVSFCEEAEFCVETFCPPSELEDWLRESWIEYDISAVLAGSQRVAPNPVVLGKQYDEFFTARLVSPSEALDRECAEVDQEDAAISALNRLHFESEADDDELP